MIVELISIPEVFACDTIFTAVCDCGFHTSRPASEGFHISRPWQSENAFSSLCLYCCYFLTQLSVFINWCWQVFTNQSCHTVKAKSWYSPGLSYPKGRYICPLQVTPMGVECSSGVTPGRPSGAARKHFKLCLSV